MTFVEVFTGVFTAQVSLWIIDRYIKTHVNKHADKLDKLLGIKKSEENKNGIIQEEKGNTDRLPKL